MGRHSATGRTAGRVPGGTRIRAGLAAGLASVGALGGLGIGGVGVADADAELVEGTPCTQAASACVSLEDGRAWLIDDGEIVRGPVAMSHGAAATPTPRGEFTVEWKNRDHRSREFNGAPMPYAVFFAAGGIAFHQGALDRPSAGCVRLASADAAAFYEFLDVGDRVEVR